MKWAWEVEVPLKKWRTLKMGDNRRGANDIFFLNGWLKKKMDTSLILIHYPGVPKCERRVATSKQLIWKNIKS